MSAFADDNPYDVLGIAPDADEAAIKAAHRKKAREWHPDHNKSANAQFNFCRVQNAYELLMDAETRAHYDRTGVKGEASVEPAAQGNLISLCLQWAIQAEVHQDFRVFARVHLNAQIAQFGVEIERAKNAAAKLAKKVKRLTRRGDKSNFLADALAHRAEELEDNAADAARMRKRAERALELVEEFDYDARPDLVQTYTLGFMRHGFVTPGVE